MSNTSLLTCVFGQYNFADADVMTRKPTRMRVRLPRSINFANAFTDVQKRWTSRFHRIGSNLQFLPVPNKEQVPMLVQAFCNRTTRLPVASWIRDRISSSGATWIKM